MERILIPIVGMSCGGCAQSVRDVLARLPGVHVEQVVVGTADVTFDPALTTPDQLRAAITRAGFEAPAPINVR